MTQEIRSIPLKFWLPASLLAVLLIYGFLSLVIYGHWREVAHRDEHWRFWSQAVAVMQQEFGLALLSDDQAGIQRVITSYGVDPALRVLAVEMPDGRVTHANQLAWRGRLASEVLPDYLGGVTSEILQLESGGQHRLAGVADLPGAEGSAARLHFSYELGHHPAQLLAIFDRFSIGMFLLFLLLVVAPLLWALRRYVERPLSGLVKLVDEVGSSDGLKLDVRGRGEVARVAHALAGMSQAIVENMAALTKSERYLSDILEYNPVCIWIKDLKGRVTYVNRASEELVGLPRGEIVGQLDVDLWPDEAESMREHDQLIITSGRADQFLQRLTAEGGRIHWGLTTQFPLKDASGAVYAVGSIRVDTTEQEQLRQQLIRRKARLEKVSGMAMRLTGDPLEVMPQIAEMMSQFLGCRGAGILQVRGDQMLPLALRIDGVAYPERPPLPLVPGGVIAEAVASRTPRAVDKFHGTYRDSPLAQFTDLRCAHVHPVIDKSDAIIATLFILDDTPIRLSEEEQELMGIIALRVALEMARWRAQRAARLTEQRYRTLMELTATGYVLVDARGRVLEANEQYCKFTGRDQLDQIVGRCVSEWTPDEAWPELKSILQEVGTSGEGWSGMVEFEQPDHTRRPLMVQSSYIDNEQ
ncbi:MAG: PAS domain S-box protein, partial [Gammaproteobacteria bacterium]|nr:PAS domain S-box protein [Gammaproteobacteria bacterium]